MKNKKMNITSIVKYFISFYMHKIRRRQLSILFIIFAFIISNFNCNCGEKQFSNYGGTIKEYNWEKLAIGMNLPEFTYWQPGTVFTDIMKSASGFVYYDSGNNELYNGLQNPIENSNINLDSNGYPSSIPQTCAIGNVDHCAFVINNYYPAGRYNIFFSGAGTFGGAAQLYGSQYYVNLTGDGTDIVITITSSTLGNNLRNIRILPAVYDSNDVEGTDYPTFFAGYLAGLEPFHCIRFMDWFGTNNSYQVNWSDRIRTTLNSQGRGNVAYEYAIELCNILDVDAWVCVPHMASDDYIRQMAILWRDSLETGLKIYLEYSNEVWNWGFWQTHWIDNNGIYDDGSYPAVDAYVRTDLAAIEAAGGGYPEKDAYMMARIFNLWADVFGAETALRIVRVGTGQQAWTDNSRRILEYLFNTDTNHTGCDEFAVGGYIGMEKEQHDIFINYGQNLSFGIMYYTMVNKFNAEEKTYILETAGYARNFGVDYIVYEGGQHMLSYNNQNNWPYLQMLYDFQVQPYMYNLYSMNFSVHVSQDVDCKLFMAYDYIGPRQSIYGSWGHLERLDQISTDYKVVAPKYQALLDANSPK
jgi:hypothetical protein